MSHTGRVTFAIAGAAEHAIAPPDFDAAAEVWRDNADAICARGIATGDDGWMEVPGVAVFRFDRERRAVTAITELGVDPDLLRDNYYRAALPMALQFFGFEVLHASAVRTAAGVVAFCAISETGKSTTVAALSRRGYPLWADDAVPFEVDDSRIGVRAMSVPFRLRLDAGPAEFFRYTDNSFRWPEPGSLEMASAPIAALCVLQRENHAPHLVEIQRLSAVDAVTSLLPHAYCFSLADPDRKSLMMRRYFDLAARVPVFRVSLATGLEKLPAALDQIERSIPGFTHPRES